MTGEEEKNEVSQETKQEAPAENGVDDNNNGPSSSGGNRAQLAELPLEWTQMGKCEDETPSMPIRFPSDVISFTKDDEEIMSVGTAGQKITKMGDKFYEEASPKLKRLIFRSHLIKTIEGLDGFQELELLELYDNMVDELRNLNDGEGGAPGKTLTVLDISYNAIRDMQPVEFCPNLTELCKSYWANDKLLFLNLNIDAHVNSIDLFAPVRHCQQQAQDIGWAQGIEQAS
jgi:hypothetical protein